MQYYMYNFYCFSKEKSFYFAMFSFIIVFLGLINAQQGWTDEFEYFNSSLWIQDTTVDHCDDICFIAMPDHLTYNSSDISSNSGNNKGLLVTLNDIPCNTNKSSCCSGSKCANYAAGHLTSKNYYKYGHFEWYSTKVAHGNSTNIDGPMNEFTCMSCYTDNPVHNEIAMCVNHTSNQIHCAYWYNNKMNRKIITINDVNLEESYHDYHFKWSDSVLEYFYDDETLWKITNNESELPYESCSIRIILRPTGDPTYKGPAYFFVDKFSWNPI